MSDVYLFTYKALQIINGCMVALLAAYTVYFTFKASLIHANYSLMPVAKIGALCIVVHLQAYLDRCIERRVKAIENATLIEAQEVYT